METLGMRVRDLREKKGLSLRAFAGQAGVSLAMQHYVETGQRSPSPGILAQIADGLGVPLTELQVLDPHLPGGGAALHLALAGEWDDLLGFLEGLDDGYLERLREAAGLLEGGVREVLGRRHS